MRLASVTWFRSAGLTRCQATNWGKLQFLVIDGENFRLRMEFLDWGVLDIHLFIVYNAQKNKAIGGNNMFGDFIQSIDLLERLRDLKIKNYIEADKKNERRRMENLSCQAAALKEAIIVLRAAWDSEETKYAKARGE